MRKTTARRICNWCYRGPSRIPQHIHCISCWSVYSKSSFGRLGYWLTPSRVGSWGWTFRTGHICRRGSFHFPSHIGLSSGHIPDSWGCITDSAGTLLHWSRILLGTICMYLSPAVLDNCLFAGSRRLCSEAGNYSGISHNPLHSSPGLHFPRSSQFSASTAIYPSTAHGSTRIRSTTYHQQYTLHNSLFRDLIDYKLRPSQSSLYCISSTVHRRRVGNFSQSQKPSHICWNSTHILLDTWNI